MIAQIISGGVPYTYRGSQKKNPSNFLFIFQQCVQIFEWNFAQLLNSKIYTLTPTSVEIYLKITCLINTDLITKRPILLCSYGSVLVGVINDVINYADQKQFYFSNIIL